MNKRNILIHIVGWRAMPLQGDPSLVDRWKWLKRYLLKGPIRTLDAGHGSGVFTMYAASLGNIALGVSNEKSNNQLARERAHILGLHNIQFLDLDLRELEKHVKDIGTFDQIICCEVIEHIIDDKKLIDNLVSILKPHGRLLITVPFKYSKLAWGSTSNEENGGHVRYGYTMDEICKLCDERGLEIIIKDGISGFITQQIIYLQSLISPINYRLAWAITFPLRIFQVFDLSVTKLFNYPYLSIGIIGIKR